MLKTLFKKLFLIASILLVNVLAVNAMVNVTAFSLPANYLVSEKLNIPNPTLNTSFQFNVSFLRYLLSNGSFEGVTNSSVTLVYSDCGECGTYTEISTIRHLSEADFYQSNNAHLTLNAQLPANKTTGFIMVKHVYFDTNQNKILTQYISNSKIFVQVSSSYISPAILTKISNMGFSTDGITSGSDYFLVEEDIMLSKAFVNSYVLNTPLPVVTGDNINILIPFSSFASSTWYSAIMGAARAWNTASNSNIKLHVIIGGISPFFTQPDRIDITLSESSIPSNIPVISRFVSNDGKPGNQILINKNFRYPNTNALPDDAQSAWNVIQAVGHCLGFKHTSDFNNANSVMKRGTSSSSGYQLSTNDVEMVNAKYPLNSSNQVVPFISGKSPLVVSESANYEVSYFEAGMTYSWRVIGINGTVFDETYSSIPILSDVSFTAGNYELQCTMNSLKHGIVVATKIIVVN